MFKDRTVRPLTAIATLVVLLMAQAAHAFDWDRWLPVDPLLVQWWQLYTSVPTNVREALGGSNDACALGQNGAVWYVTSQNTFNTPLVQHCRVPKGKLLMIPALLVICTPFPGETLAENVQFCREFLDPFDKITFTFTVDGVNRRRLVDRHAHSVAFPVSFPENNLFDSPDEDVPGGLYQAVAEGQYALLELPVGHHTVHTRAASSSDPSLGYFDVTFEIDVVAATPVGG